MRGYIPLASLLESEWQTVRQKKVRDVKYGTIKSYISDNGVQVLDIRILSKEEWNNQSCVTLLHVKEPTVSDPEFWPEDIWYRRSRRG